MQEHDPFDDFEIIDTYGLDDAIADGVVIPVTVAVAEPPPDEPVIPPLSEISSMDEYLKNFGKILGKKAVTSLAPLHIPNRDVLPDFSDIPDNRTPFDCQKHAIAATVQMMNTVGSGFMVGEMGTGKTLMGMVAALKHAQQPRRKGGYNGKFRCLVLCPDHLIGKWEREIKETIPDAKVTHFGPITEAEEASRRTTDARGGQAYVLADLFRVMTEAKRGNHWSQPEGPEYYILGRNQAKWYPDWLGTSDPYTGFDGQLVETPVSSRIKPVDSVPVTDEAGRPVLDPKTGDVKMQNITARVFTCPHCGTVARDKKGLPLSAKDISRNKTACEGRYLKQIAATVPAGQHGLDRRCPIPKRFAGHNVGNEVTCGGLKYVVKECKEPLWWFTSRPYRWAPSRIIQKKMRKFFQYLLIDEVHEQKSDNSAQSMACGKLIASARHTVALTGTIIGGYANHIYPLMMRIAPQSLREEGFEWGKDLAFSEAYGRIDRIVTTKEEDSTPTVGKSVRSMRRARSGKATERKAVRPGIMPTLFGKHMIGNSIFITLDEMASELPDLFEYIGGECPPPPEPPSADATDADRDQYAVDLDRYERAKLFWVNTCCDMEPAQRGEYDRVESILNFACKELLKRGSMKLLGSMLWTTLGWPDYGFAEWTPDDELRKAVARANVELAEKAAEEGKPAPNPIRTPHTVGYWDKPGNKLIENWMGVVTPKVIDAGVTYPKEDRLIDICLRHKSAGNQVWVYVQMTQKRNVTIRLKSLLERVGLKVGIMRSDDVDPKEREDWITKHGRDFDVMICHPKLVSTGLDLFSKAQGGHNYNAIVFYETGYNLFDMRQAARRSWRIGQPRDCFVYYLYYGGTMQHRAMSLMSKKMAAAHALEGEFSEDGLAAMAGEDNMQMALAKSLAAKIDDKDMQRSWSKVKSGEKKKVKRPNVAAKPSPLDKLPIEEQLVAATILDRQTKPTPNAAVADINAFAAMLAQADAGMWGAARAMADDNEYEPVDLSSPEPEPATVVIMPTVEPEPVADEPEPVVEPEPEPAPEPKPVPMPTLRIVMPEPAPALDPILAGLDIPEFDEALLAKMFANLAAHGMTLEDLAC